MQAFIEKHCDFIGKSIFDKVYTPKAGIVITFHEIGWDSFTVDELAIDDLGNVMATNYSSGERELTTGASLIVHQHIDTYTVS